MADLSLTPEEFSRFGKRVVQDCVDYLDKLDRVSIVPLQDSYNHTKVSYETEPLPETGKGEKALECIPALFRQCCVVNGRFFGFVTGTGVPIAALADLAVSVANQNNIAPYVAPSGIAMERTVVHWLAQMVGCPGFGGSLTSGGSLSNLMGLTMAREAKVPANEWGVAARKVVFYASKEVHMSTPKAMALLGLGRRSLRLLDVDDQYRLRGDSLARAIAEDRAAGRLPVAVVASAGSTRTGSVDPIDELADVAENEGLWLHVDGAYGVFAAAVVPDKFRGLHRANSISLDPHKWLYMPLDCGCLLFRQRQDAVRAFSFFDDYALSPTAVTSNNNDICDYAAFYEESLELSRRLRAFKIYLALHYHGMETFRNSISANLEQARLLAELVDDQPELQLTAPVELSIVCFRMVRFGDSDVPQSQLDDFNVELLAAVIRRGRVYLSKVTIDGEFSLRACITNHLTTTADVHTIIKEVLQAAKESNLNCHRPLRQCLSG